MRILTQPKTRPLLAPWWPRVCPFACTHARTHARARTHTQVRWNNGNQHLERRIDQTMRARRYTLHEYMHVFIMIVCVRVRLLV